MRDQVAARRRDNMLKLALDLCATGDLRDDLDDDEINAAAARLGSPHG